MHNTALKLLQYFTCRWQGFLVATLLYLFNNYYKISKGMYQRVKESDHGSLEIIVLGNFNCIV